MDCSSSELYCAPYHSSWGDELQEVYLTRLRCPCCGSWIVESGDIAYWFKYWTEDGDDYVLTCDSCNTRFHVVGFEPENSLNPECVKLKVIKGGE